MQKFKSFIFYLLTYVLISLTTAFGVVLISDPTGANSIKIGESATETLTPPQLNYIVNNLSTVKAVNANINANINTKTDSFNINLDVKADFNSGFNNPEVMGNLNVTINSNPIEIKFVYKNEAIYLNLFNKNFKIETTNLIGSIKQILTLLNVELPEINLGIDLNDLSLDSILGMLTDLTEEKQTTQTIITIALPVVGNLTAVCDLNYAIKQLSLPASTIGDITFDVNASVSYPTKVEVNEPNENCLDVTNLFTIVESLINTTKQQQLGFKVDAKVDDYNLSGTLNLNLQDFSLSFNTEILNNKLSVTLLNNTAYLTLGNINLKFDLQDANKVTNLLSNQFNIEIPLDKILGIIASVKNGEIANQLNNFDINSIDFDSIDLSFIDGSKIDDNTYLVNLENIGDVTLKLNNSKIESVKFDNENTSVSLSATKYSDIKLDDVEYANIATLIPTVNKIINTSRQTLFTGVISLTYNNNTYNVNYTVQNKNGLYINLNTLILNKPLEISIVNNVCYITYSNTKLFVNISDINELINLIITKFNIELPTNSANIMFNEILKLINSEINPNFISSLSEIKDGVQIELLNKLNLKIVGNNTIENINAKYNNIELNITLNASLNNLEVPTFDSKNYTNIYDLTNTVLNVYDYVTNKKLYFDVNLTYDNIKVDGKVYFDNSLTLDVNTTLFNKQINVKLVENVVYVNIDGLKVKFDLTETEAILNFVKEKFGIDGIAEIKKLIASVDYNEMLSNIDNLDFEITLNKIDVALNDLKLLINLKNNNLENININKDNLNAVINILAEKQEIEVNNEEYFNLVNAMPLVNGLVNTINTNAIGGKLIVSANNNEYVVNLKVNLSNPIQVWAQTNIYGSDIRLNLYNNTIYLSVNELNLKFGLNEIDKLVNFINSNFNLNINLSSFDFNSINLDSINFSDIKFVEASNSHFVINLFGAPITILFDDYVNLITANYNNIDFNFEINALGDAITLPTINVKVYENLDYLLSLASNVIETIKTNNIELSGTLAYSKLNATYDANINYNNGLKANINLNLYGKNINVIVDDNVAYVNADGFKAYLDLSKLNSITEQINNGLNINLNDMLNINESDIYLKTLAKQNNTITLTVYINGKPLSVKVNLENNNTLKDINLNAFGLTGTVNLNKSNNTIDYIKTDYTTCINNFDDIVTPIINIVKNKQLSINGNISLKLLGAKQNVIINNLSVNFENELKAYANVSFNGITANVTLQNSTIYINACGLKVKFALTEINNLINWINTTFKTKINLDLSENFNIEEILNKFSFEVIKGINKTPNGICIDLNSKETNNNLIYVDYNNTLTKIVGGVNDFNIELSVLDKANIPAINQNEYINYTELIKFINSILNYFKLKQYGVTANATVYNDKDVRYNANVNLQVNMLNKFELSGNAKLTGEQNIGFDLNYYNQYLFVNYNNLKLKICENDLKELLVIAMEMVGINPNILPFLTDVANGMDINIGNISGLLPGGDGGNPLSMLKIIKNISYTNNSLVLTLNGKLISENPNADEMNIIVKTNGETLTNISVTNLYTGVTENEYFNLDVNFGAFNKVTAPENPDSYIDLSGANELIKAIINTAELSYFEIDGSLKINGKLIGIPISWNVPLNIKVKLDENHINPEIMAVIGEIPTMVGVNNDVPYDGGDTESGHDRMLYVYYKSGYVYFYRSEYVNRFAASARKYEKKLMVSLQELLNNPLDYLQYGVGFTNDIMGAIRSSLELSKGHTPDLGNIINSFKANNKTDFSVELNMKELTNDPKMGTMTVGLNVINNAETNNKNYIGKASFNMFMPLASVFELTLDSDNLTLINIGKELDFTNLYNYINTYSYAENAKWEASNGNWTLSSEKQYTLSFVTNCDITVENITATINSPISVPTFANRTQIDSSTNARYTYRFDGWYTTENFKSGTEFNSSTMPRGDTTIYAKWTIINVENIVTITFNSNGGTAYDSISELAGTSIDVSNYVPHKCDDKVKGSYKAGKGYLCTHTRYTFEGWYTDANFTTRFNGYMPNGNTTLYAKYSVTTFQHYWGAFGTSCKENCH